MCLLCSHASPSHGYVYFPDEGVQKPDRYQRLAALGIECRPVEPDADTHWGLDLRHKEWGPAALVAFKAPALPTAAQADRALGLEPRERELFKRAKSDVGLMTPPLTRNVLRDRKVFLRYLRAVMGDDGIMGVDAVSKPCWSRDHLDEELAHDAELDVESIFSVSMGDHPGGGAWVRSQGLGSAGAYDFDIVDAEPGVMPWVVRGLAYASLDDRLQPGAELEVLRPGGPMLAVASAEFEAKGDRRFRGWHDKREVNSRRVVLCEPRAPVWKRALGLGRYTPAQALKHNPAGALVLHPDTVHAITQRRAQATIGRLRAFLEEFADVEHEGLVKLGFPTDDGVGENPWFKVLAIDGDRLDGECVNTPVRIPNLRLGDRVSRPLHDVLDWAIHFMHGEINPRWMSLAREIRADRQKFQRPPRGE